MVQEYTYESFSKLLRILLIDLTSASTSFVGLIVIVFFDCLI